MFKKILLSDVAKLANASRAAASKVLNASNGNIRISEETRERILAAARKLGYQQNRIAASLAGGKSMLIGVILESCANYRSLALMSAIEAAASAHGYQVLIATSHNSYKAVAKSLQTFQEYNVDGTIVLNHDYPEFRQEFRQIFQSSDKIIFFEKPEFPVVHWVGSARGHAFSSAISEMRKCGGKRFAVAHSSLDYYSERQLCDEFRSAWLQAEMQENYGRCFGYPQEILADYGARSHWLLTECIEKYQPDVLYCDDAITALALQSRMTPEQLQKTTLLGGNANPLFNVVSPSIKSFDPQYKLIAEELVARAMTPTQDWKNEIIESLY